MKNLLTLLLLFSFLVFCSCEKTEKPIDYSGPVAVYMKGNDTFVKPVFNYYLTFQKTEYQLLAFFKDKEVDPQSVLLALQWPITTEFKKGQIVEPNVFSFKFPGDPSLNSREKYKGEIICLGESDGLITLQFKDLSFKVKRDDGSDTVDEYYVRGTYSAKPLK